VQQTLSKGGVTAMFSFFSSSGLLSFCTYVGAFNVSFYAAFWVSVLVMRREEYIYPYFF